MKLPGSMKKNSEQFTQSSFPARPNLRGEIPFKGGRFVTPTFCIIEFCQDRRALGCIFGNFSLKKRFSQFNWPKVASMVWHIFFHKSLRSLE
jgi:hypothetical protein